MYLYLLTMALAIKESYNIQIIIVNNTNDDRYWIVTLQKNNLPKEYLLYWISAIDIKEIYNNAIMN